MKQTVIYNNTSNTPIGKKDFSETDKLVFDFFQSVSNEDYQTLSDFVVFVNGDADLVEVLFCKVALDSHGIGDITLSFLDLKERPKIVRAHLHDCMVSSIVNNSKCKDINY